MKHTRITTLSSTELPLEIEDRMYVDGEFTDSEETFDVENPATGEHLASVPLATPSQIDRAVEASRRASEVWRKTPPMERRQRLEKLADVIDDATTELTRLDVADNGSCISRMRDDVGKGTGSLRYFGGLATELKGETIPTGSDNFDYTIREPYGAVAGIIPFNHPMMFAIRRIAPAVAAGNGIIIKPSEYTPLSALYIAYLVDEADVFPDGLVNVVTGAGDVGECLVQHPSVRLISMTGSLTAGQEIMKNAADRIAPVILELGGNNPAIVFPDANLGQAAKGIFQGMALKWQGQSCGSSSRALLHEAVYDDVLADLRDRFESVQVGDPFEEETNMGSIVSEPQFQKVREHIERSKEEGATLVTGGDVIDEYDGGYFVEPTIFEVTQEMSLATEEVFGPVLAVLEWSDREEMLSVANDPEYGLTASVWTSDIDTGHRTANTLEAGYVWINDHGTHHVGAPFGGYKQSGIGKNESIEELRDHTRVKNVNVKFTDEDN